VVDCEDCNAGGYECDDEVFVEGVGFAEDREVQEHDGEKLAGFSEDESYVVDVGEGGVTEGGSEGGGYGDEDKGEEDGAGGKYGGWRRGGWGGEEKVGVAC